jgi:putative ABC transport system substrate-binding protein
MIRKMLGPIVAAILPFVISHLSQAQEGVKPRRVGVLQAGSQTDPFVKRLFQALLDGLREHGWEDERNVLIEARFSGQDPTRFPEMAAELVALKVDVIVAGTTQAIEAARRKTTTIPIVMVTPSDPVGSGFVASFARPGGNITGLANHLNAVSGKLFEVLKAVNPGIERVGVMYNPDNAASGSGLKHQQEQVAPRLGLVVVPIPVSRPADFEEAFALIARERLHALVVHPAPPLSGTHREKIAAFAIKQRLPTATAFAVMARDGLMISYGFDAAASYRRSAAYVDRILKGANPAELPVEQAERYELVVNLKTARELGLTIPASILLRADEVIE